MKLLFRLAFLFVFICSSLNASFNPDQDDVYLWTDKEGRKNFYEILNAPEKANTKSEMEAQKNAIKNECAGRSSSKQVSRACEVLNNAKNKELYDLRLAVVQKMEKDAARSIKAGISWQTTPKASDNPWPWVIEIKYNLPEKMLMQINANGSVIVKDYPLQASTSKKPAYLRLANVDMSGDIEIDLFKEGSKSYDATFIISDQGKNVFVKVDKDKSGKLVLLPQEGNLFKKSTSGLSLSKNVDGKQIKKIKN